jgi:hypothetical protein
MYEVELITSHVLSSARHSAQSTKRSLISGEELDDLMNKFVAINIVDKRTSPANKRTSPTNKAKKAHNFCTTEPAPSSYCKTEYDPSCYEPIKTWTTTTIGTKDGNQTVKRSLRFKTSS